MATERLGPSEIGIQNTESKECILRIDELRGGSQMDQ